MIEFKKLFEVKFFHGFYDMYTSKDINVVLPIETLKLISMYSLVYRATADGFVVLYKSVIEYVQVLSFCLSLALKLNKVYLNSEPNLVYTNTKHTNIIIFKPDPVYSVHCIA